MVFSKKMCGRQDFSSTTYASAGTRGGVPHLTTSTTTDITTVMKGLRTSLAPSILLNLSRLGQVWTCCPNYAVLYTTSAWQTRHPSGLQWTTAPSSFLAEPRSLECQSLCASARGRLAIDYVLPVQKYPSSIFLYLIAGRKSFSCLYVIKIAQTATPTQYEALSVQSSLAVEP